jgi:sodium pump decarboxylase gamma subunit
MNGLHFLAEIDVFDQVMNNPGTLGERLVKGLQTLGLGMAIVFAVLIIIWGACELLHIAVHGTGKKNKGVTPVVAPPPAVTVAPAPTPAPTVTDDSELIAVITAAVAAVLDQPTTSFRVVSFRRTGDKGRAWNTGHAE